MRLKYYRRSEDLAVLVSDMGLDALYAPIAKGVTNGDSHDHDGGDGTAITKIQSDSGLEIEPTTSNCGASLTLKTTNQVGSQTGGSPTAKFYDGATFAGEIGVIVGDAMPFRFLTYAAKVDRHGNKLPMYFRTQNAIGEDVIALQILAGANAGNVYVEGNLSFASFTDRTPLYVGDALSDIRKISGKDGKIDHSTLPEFARRTVEHLDASSQKSVINVERDIGAMISIHTSALQQLIDLVEKQGAEIEKLKAKKS